VAATIEVKNVVFLRVLVPHMKKSSDKILVVLVAVGNQKEAIRIGQEMVNARLAACVNIITGVQSIYRWKGKVVKAKEVILTFKSTALRYQALEKAIKTMHTYETPEIIALPVNKGLDQYVEWVRDETHS
jgi:periplasmic divalent cation tolerance protein